MAELTPQERLQPCLLDRLTDHEPHSQQEGRDRRIMSLQRFRNAVLRDLSWLLNARAHIERDGFEEFEEVSSSVINFGVRDVAGLSAGSPGVLDLERQITNAVKVFEPRIDERSVGVSSQNGGKDEPWRAVSFEIRGDLWAQPVPESLLIKTDIDLETGECRVRQGG